LRAAIQRRVDAIVVDAGSMAAGPYYLGSGEQYFQRSAVKLDYRHMVEAGLETGAPVIVGSCGMGGGDRNLAVMIEIAKEVFTELGVRDAKVAVIGAQVSPEVVLEELRSNRLLKIGNLPTLSEDAVGESMIVGQMGVHPIITALDAGARFILAGRACDAALFAADMIRRGIDAGLAYHAGLVLSVGALACEPSSSSDCLVGEVYTDGSVIFSAPAEHRRCTPFSISMLSLRGASHPHLQFYPEGVLVTDQTKYFAHGERSAGLRHSQFLRTYKPWPLSIKLEGARRIGQRRVSLLRIDPADALAIPPQLPLYGRNGVQARLRDSSHLSLDAGEAYEWSVHHLLRNSGDIRETLFAITHYRASGSTWTRSGEERPVYFDIGGEDPGGVRTDRMLSLIADAPPNSQPTGLRALGDMARIIRSTNSGASHVIFDIVFATPADYEMALHSNLFFKDNIAEVLGVSAERVIGSYFVDSCSAIKITLDRSTVAASSDERDVFGAQQYARLQSLRIPTSPPDQCTLGASHPTPTIDR
jgi:Domain of unknown function (DUF4387)/Acyclic terpene utilisation family protein AtuA